MFIKREIIKEIEKFRKFIPFDLNLTFLAWIWPFLTWIWPENFKCSTILVIYYSGRCHIVWYGCHVCWLQCFRTMGKKIDVIDPKWPHGPTCDLTWPLGSNCDWYDCWSWLYINGTHACLMADWRSCWFIPCSLRGRISRCHPNTDFCQSRTTLFMGLLERYD